MEGVMMGVMIGLIDNGFAKRTHLSRYSLYPLCFYSLSSRNLYCLLYCLLYYVFSTTVFSVLSVLSLFGCVQAMSITQVIEACSNEDESCLRKDNSHGHWGSCNADANVAVNDDCNYFSPMYYRDLKKGEQPPTPPSTANTT